MIPSGSLAVFVTPKNRRRIRRLNAGEIWQSNEGALAADDVRQLDFGDVARTSLGAPVRIERPTLVDLLMGVKRSTQIIYPKDIAHICLKLGVGPERTIVEAGCGSGALTLALSWFCGPTGKVVSHDSREEFAALARRNLEWAGLGENVEIHVRDIADGFAVRDADALFLDVREPWLYLAQIVAALKPGSPCAFLLPTTNQISRLLAAFENVPFGGIEVCELLLRSWKPLADRLRPEDRMAAHTGFLIFARLQTPSELFDNYLAPGTRERKQKAAELERRAAFLEDSGESEN